MFADETFQLFRHKMHRMPNQKPVKGNLNKSEIERKYINNTFVMWWNDD